MSSKILRILAKLTSSEIKGLSLDAPKLSLYKQLSKGTKLYGVNNLEHALVDQWVTFGMELVTSEYKLFLSHLSILNSHLTLRSFIVGYNMTVADLVCYVSIKESNIWSGKAFNRASFFNVQRWIEWIEYHDEIVQVFQDEVKENKKANAGVQGSFELDLEGFEDGAVVTRFPPEPSGYLHIGHAKAVLLNEYFARRYNGTLLCRFDDTNPSKEKSEFEQSIIEDLALLGVSPDKTSYTSDHFETIHEFALKLIKSGDAYVDDTPVEKMREERTNGIASINRNKSVEENLRLFEEMKKGSEIGVKNCLRAKISVDDNNKAMRDPVIYRCNLLPHHRAGEKYKMYPTYDFACPIVDSIEGVTHALRTNEYADRNSQYYWFIEKLNLRKPLIWDYSRLNFVYTLLSKRKLTWFVEKGLVRGWDDPRFPTVRGIRRRGMTIEALKEYILLQGASKNTLVLSWDKIWAINKQKIDPVAPRYTTVDKKDCCKVVLEGAPVKAETKTNPLHKKNPEIGTKDTVYMNTIYLDNIDGKDLQEGEEVTLMDWGNVIITKRISENEVHGKLHLEGDFKKTKKKLTWLAETSKTHPWVNIVVHDFDYLITKPKLEEEDELNNFVTGETEFLTEAHGDWNMKALKKGDIIQLERKGYYIVDSTDGSNIHLFTIPDGSQKSIASKANPDQPTSVSRKKVGNSNTSSNNNGGKNKKDAKESKSNNVNANDVDTSGIKMYPVKPLYNMDEIINVSGIKMYKVKPFYPNLLDLGKKKGYSTTSSQKTTEDKKDTKAKSKVTTEKLENDILDVQRVDLRVGKIIEVKPHPDAESLYVEQIDFGNGPKTVVSGLVKYVPIDQMKDRMVIVVANLKPAKMRGIESQGMVLVAADSQDPMKKELLEPPSGSKPGDIVFFEGLSPQPESVLNPKKKIFESVKEDLKTNDKCLAQWKGHIMKTDKGPVSAKTVKNGGIS